MEKYLCTIPVMKTYQFDIEANNYKEAQQIILNGDEEMLKSYDSNPLITYPESEDELEIIWRGAITELDWNEWEILPNGIIRKRNKEES